MRGCWTDLALLQRKVALEEIIPDERDARSRKEMNGPLAFGQYMVHRKNRQLLQCLTLFQAFWQLLVLC